jgi:2-polyprenyl-6-hydroxyphenyl methylase/3-demethylubiquinone-9 3-methyltransferase
MSTNAVREKFLAYNVRQLEARRYDGFRNELKYFRRIKPLSPTDKFLDVGCGPGLLTEFMIEQGVNGLGIDIDAQLVKTAKTRLEKREMKAGFLVGRTEQLPYRDGVFDICVANSLLEHALDWEATLKEITRILKPGGLLVFYTTNRLHPFQAEVNNFPFYPWIPGPLKTIILRAIMKHRPDMVNYTDLPAIHWFTYEQLKRFLDRLGYVVSTRLDLVEESDLRGWKAAARPSLRWLKNIGIARYLYYFYSRDVSVYAIKRSA